ncbi:hypothetical protein K1719_000214 [Acacia pycnantha]|nr:hypothetical protein K1719_000214 [Acacia pycnantha]
MKYILNEIYLKLRTSTAPPLKLIDLPGLDQRIIDDKMISEYIEHNDAILLVIVPAAQAPEISSSRALRVVKEYDAESTRTVGVISKIDQAASEPKALAAVQALLSNQGPPKTSDIPWIAIIDSHSYEAQGSKSPFWAFIILQGKSQVVQEELMKLGEQMVSSPEGTRALALQLCREFEDKFLQHLAGGEGNGWKVVASFEGNFPNRIKQLPIDRHFDINNVKRIVLEADGYQPYLISPEKGLRSLIKGVLEMAKEPSRLPIELGHFVRFVLVHRVLLDIVSSAASATLVLEDILHLRELVALASSALDGFKNESKKMVVALVDMERAFVPPQHFIRLVQRRKADAATESALNLRRFPAMRTTLLLLGHSSAITILVFMSITRFEEARDLTQEFL